jgi:hypothetical protein
MLINFITAIFVCFGCANDDETQLIDEVVGRYQKNPKCFETFTEQGAKSDLERVKAIYGAGFSKHDFNYSQVTSPSFGRLRQLFEAFPAEFQRYTPEQIDHEVDSYREAGHFAISILDNRDIDSAMASVQGIFQQMLATMAYNKETKAPDFVDVCFRQLCRGRIKLSIYPDNIWSNIPDWGGAYVRLVVRLSLFSIFIEQASYDGENIPIEIMERQLKEINFCLRLIAE